MNEFSKMTLDELEKIIAQQDAILSNIRSEWLADSRVYQSRQLAPHGKAAGLK